jgi:hypothetical protein
MRNRLIVRHLRRVFVKEEAVLIASQAVRNLADDRRDSPTPPKEQA